MNAWSYGYNEPRQIYRSVYMDGLLLTVSDRLLRIDDLKSKATQVSSKVSLLSLLALLGQKYEYSHLRSRRCSTSRRPTVH